MEIKLKFCWGKVTKDNYLEIEKQTKIRQFHGREIA